MANHLKSIVRDNVLKIMAGMPDRDTPTKLSKKCYWPRGKRAGKRVAARTVGYLFESESDSPSPTVDMIEAISIALQTQPWKLFSPDNLVLFPSSANESVAAVASLIPLLNDDGLRELEEQARFIAGREKFQLKAKEQM